jgi:hypothetical protein
MNIPTYKANVGQYNVPSMNNAGEQQNANIVFEGLASLNSAITKTAINMYENEKAEEAKIQAAKDIEEGNTSLENLPIANTRGQQIYNEAAIDYYANSFNLDNEKALNEIREQNKDNPAQYLIDSEAYLKGVSANIPAHLKSKILYPVQVHSNSNYNALLKAHSAKQFSILSETRKYNLYNQANALSSVDVTSGDGLSRTDAGIQKARFKASLMGAVQNNYITADEAYTIEKLGNKNMNIAWLQQSLAAAKTLEEKEKIRNDFMLGKTGVKAIDSTSVSERFEIHSFVTEKQHKAAQADIELKEVADKKYDMQFDDELIQVAKTVSQDPFITKSKESALYDSMFAKARRPEQIEKLKKVINGDYGFTLPSVERELRNLRVNGLFTEANVIALAKQGGMSRATFDAQMAKFNDVYTENTEGSATKGAYKQITNKAKNIFRLRMTKEYGEVRANAAADYFYQNWENFLMEDIWSPEQMIAKADELFEDAYEHVADSSDMFIAPVTKARLDAIGITDDDYANIGSSFIKTVEGNRGKQDYGFRGSERDLYKATSNYLAERGITATVNDRVQVANLSRRFAIEEAKRRNKELEKNNGK